MIIDFHTHAFPDALAEKAIPLLAKKGNITAHGLGTVSDLVAKMDEDGIDKSVVLSIATKPEQETNVNNFAISLLGNDRIIPFGSVYPGSGTAMTELERLKNAGIKGIKLHPEYQQFYIDSENAIEVFNKCAELDLIVLLHCGGDVAFDPPVHADPERIERIARLCPDTTFVCAHMGGYNMWQEFSQKVTAHSNLYIDTSMTGTVAILDTETARLIIDIHGVDKFLFGSDMPWERQYRSVDKLLSFGLSEEENRKIFSENAVKLLRM